MTYHREELAGLKQELEDLDDLQGPVMTIIAMKAAIVQRITELDVKLDSRLKPEVRLGKNRYRNRPPFSPPWCQPHPTSEGSSRTPQLDFYVIAFTIAVGLPSASRSSLAGVGSRSSTASPV